MTITTEQRSRGVRAWFAWFAQPLMQLPISPEMYVQPVDRGNWRPWHPEQHLMTHYGIYEAVEAMGVRGN